MVVNMSLLMYLLHVLGRIRYKSKEVLTGADDVVTRKTIGIAKRLAEHVVDGDIGFVVVKRARFK